MQRSQRSELGLLLFCAVPVLLALFLFMAYQKSGVMPVSMPEFSPPALPNVQGLLPGETPRLLVVVKENIILVTLGACISVGAFLTLTGIWCDIMYRRPKTAESSGEDADQDAVDETNAPWLPGDEYAS